MEVKDIPFVIEIENVSFSNPWPESSFRGEIENYPFSFPYVIVDYRNKRVIGYIIFWHINDNIQISNIAIHPDYRRKGIARLLLQRVINSLQKEKVKYITLEVRPSNLTAQSLYRKLGFEIIGVKENYYSKPDENAIVMVKSL